MVRMCLPPALTMFLLYLLNIDQLASVAVCHCLSLAQQRGPIACLYYFTARILLSEPGLEQSTHCHPTLAFQKSKM